MSIASIASCGSSNSVRNPAPHRGFNNKARTILLDSPVQKDKTKFEGKFARTGSDEEFLKRAGVQKLNRTDSEATSGSQRSQGSSHFSNSPENGRLELDESGDFDNIDELPKVKKYQQFSRDRRFLGDIGKTKSAGDLIKRAAIQKTFQQMNILKLPSAESQELLGESTRSQSLAGIDSARFGDDDCRQLRYELKSEFNIIA